MYFSTTKCLINFMLFSIIIRTRNEEVWIKRCLKMIQAQKNQDFEILIVDNQSTDRTLEIVKDFKPSRVLTIQDFLPGKALNMGIAQARGKYIVALSAHCIPVSSSWLDELKYSIEGVNDSMVVAGYGRQVPLQSSSLSDKRDLLNTFGLDPIVQSKDFFFHNANSIVRRDFILQHPYSDEVSNVEDRVWAKKIIEQGWKISYTPFAEVYHHHGINHGNSQERLRKVSSLIEPLYREQKLEKYDEMRLKEMNAISVIVARDEKIDLGASISDARKSKFIKETIIVSPVKPLNLLPNEYWVSRNNIEYVDKLQLLEILASAVRISGVKPSKYDYCVFLSPYYALRPSNFIDSLLQRAELQYLDVCFAGKPGYPNLWRLDANENYSLVDQNTSLRENRTPLIEAFFGLGLVVSMNMLGKKSLSDGYVQIVELEDYSDFDVIIKERYI
jgi:rhamnosyltransferase